MTEDPEIVGYDLLKHGLLWKQVVAGMDDPEFTTLAKTLVANVQNSYYPRNFFEFALLDRIVTSHLRYLLILRAEAGHRKLAVSHATKKLESSGTDDHTARISAATLLRGDISDTINRLGLMLDRQLQRDLFLYLQLQGSARETPIQLPPAKPVQQLRTQGAKKKAG